MDQNTEKALQDFRDALKELEDALEVLRGVSVELKKTGDCIDNALSRFPVVRSFLVERGMEHVADLDREERRELSLHIRAWCDERARKRKSKSS